MAIDSYTVELTLHDVEYMPHVLIADVLIDALKAHPHITFRGSSARWWADRSAGAYEDVPPMDGAAADFRVPTPEEMDDQ